MTGGVCRLYDGPTGPLLRHSKPPSFNECAPCTLCPIGLRPCRPKSSARSRRPESAPRLQSGCYRIYTTVHSSTSGTILSDATWFVPSNPPWPMWHLAPGFDIGRPWWVEAFCHTHAPALDRSQAWCTTQTLAPTMGADHNSEPLCRGTCASTHPVCASVPVLTQAQTSWPHSRRSQVLDAFGFQNLSSSRCQI